MSIENVRARMAELKARIAGLSSSPEGRAGVPSPAESAIPSSSADVSTSAGGGSPALRPFNVALAAQCGEMSLKPVCNPAGALPEPIESLIAKYSAQHGLDPAVVRAVIRAESDGDPKTVSSKGAMGLMQLMPEEVKAYGVTDPFDPEQSIMGGTRQLSEKLKIFNGDLKLALAAYNAGTGRVKQYGGVPPFPETQKYVEKIFGMLGRSER